MIIKPNKQIGVGDIVIGDIEKKYLNEVIESSRISYGKFSYKFEKRVAEIHNCKYGVFCNSGTSALQMSLAALKEKYKWSDRDEIIVPALTFISTSNIVLYNNLKPIFVDVDPKTYNINPDLIEAKISNKTRAIIPVHLFGLPADMEPIIAISKKYNLKILEDSCETMFAKYKGQPVGSFGDISCFSTYVAHFLVTGVGGIAITNDSELAIIMKSIMNHGRDSIYLNIDDDKNIEGDSLFNLVSRRFKFIRLGHSWRATEFEAAIGVAQLEQKDEIVKKRRNNAEYLANGLRKHSKYLQLPFTPRDREHNFMMFPIVVKEVSKVDLVYYLEENNIETRDMVPLINQPVYEKIFGNIEDLYPVAKWINNNGFYIGCHPYLSNDDLNWIIHIFDKYFTTITSK